MTKASWVGRTRASFLLVAIALAVVPTPAPAQGTLSALQAEVDQIARRSRPSVVTVFSLRSDVQSHAPGSPAHRRTHTRVGSGVAVEENAILTTASVVLGSERLLIQTDNGLRVEGELAGIDPIFNLALIRVPGLRLPPLHMASGKSEIGDWVISLGTSYRAQSTQSVGNVAYRFREPRLSLLQLTNTVYPGNSGAAALNARGELVGIVQGELGAPDLSGQEIDDARRGTGFMLPIETVRPVYEAFRREGRVRHGFLGVTTRAASVESESNREKIPIGALVEAIVPGSPAEAIGLKRGDLIVAFERERVEYPEQLARWVAASRPSTTAAIVWVREDLEHEGTVRIVESPQAMPQWIATTPAAPGGPTLSADRINGLEREIRRLSEELERVRSRDRSRP